MGLLMFSARVHDLMRRKSDIEYRLTQLTRKLSDLQDYSAYVGNCAQGNFDIGEMMLVPGSMLGHAIAYAGGTYARGVQYAQQNAPLYYQQWLQSGGANTDAQTQQAVYQNWMAKMYEAGAEIASQRETRILKREEEKIQNEKDQQETLLKEVTQELEAAKQARDAGIKEMAPKYTAGGQ